MNRFEPKMRELYAVPRGFGDGGKPIHLTESQLQEAEKRLGARLPEDYREFIRDFGDFILHAVIPRSDGRYQGGIGEFAYINSEKVSGHFRDLVSNYLERDTGWWPENAICIGHDGNVPIFLFFEGEIHSKNYEVLELAADSFADFIKMLRNEFEEPYVEHEMEAIKEDTAPFWASFFTT